MLGVDRLEELAHHFEDELGAARRGRRAMSSVGADRLYHGIDAMRRLAVEACGGEAANVNIPDVLARLRGDSSANSSLPETVPTENLEVNHSTVVQQANAETEKQEPVRMASVEDLMPKAISDKDASLARAGVFDASPTASGSLVAPEVATPGVQSGTFKIDTIRVKPESLDSLMMLAGEMAVTTARAVKALSVIDELVDLWDEGSRGSESWYAVQDHKRSDNERIRHMRGLLARLERSGKEEIGRLEPVASELVESIKDLRLLPFSTIFNLFPRMVRDLSQEQGKLIQLEVVGGAVSADKHLLEELKDPLMHLIRNAIDHAIESPEERRALGKTAEATIRLKAYRTPSRMVIEVSDDGRGLDEKLIGETAVRKRLLTQKAAADLSPEANHRIIFTPGFSTSSLITDVSGRGVGLDVVLTNVENLKGTISVESVPGQGCTFRIEAPLSLATTRVLLVRLGKRSYAIPMEAVEKTFLLSYKVVFSMEGRPVVQMEDQPVWVAPLTELLELRAERNIPRADNDQDRAGVLLSIGWDRVGLFVDELLDEQEVIVKPFAGLLKRVRNVLGSTILSTGEVCMVLNAHDLIKSVQSRPVTPLSDDSNLKTQRKKVILLAEDSITTRTQEKRILETAGYEVVTAVDGAEAFAKLGSREFDAVVSDIEMPNMTGLQLAERIRRESRYEELPIILVTSLATDADRKKGAEVGANAYITKGTFDQNVLLETLRRLV